MPVDDLLQTWQQSLASAVRDPDELCDRLQLGEPWRQAARRAAAAFPLVVPEEFLARIAPGDPHDPLLRQVLPIGAEVDRPTETALYSVDPTGDRAARAVPGLLHKYAGRALLITTGTCAIHCRYCFRRHYPYQADPVGLAQWEPALQYLAEDSSIREVLLSGGDPLTRTDAWLARLVARLDAIPHLRRLRLHTRLPIVIPARITDRLLDWLTGSRLTPVVVVHANHPRELDDAVAHGLRTLAAAGVTVLNQAVLLRGVNDDADTLVELCERLADCRVLPYYLHQLDRVAGAGHFEVPLATGQALLATLRARLPGYLVPRFVQEVPGATGKVEIPAANE